MRSKRETVSVASVSKRNLMLNLMVNSYLPGRFASLAPCLPMGAASSVTTRQDPLNLVLAQHQFVHKIHPSWIQDALDVLPPCIAQPVASMTLKPEATHKVKKIFEPFLLDALIKALGLHNLLPLEFLPPHPITPLFKASQQQVENLIGCLSMIDLAHQLPKIVDKQRLLMIYQTINETQSSYLKKVRQHHVPPLKDAPNYLKGRLQPKTLHQVLKQRGMQLFVSTLDSVPHLTRWYLSRIFDKTLAHVILKTPGDASLARVTEPLLNELLEVML